MSATERGTVDAPAEQTAAQNGLSVALQVPGPITSSPRPEQVRVALRLRNDSQQPVTLKFRSGQTFEVELFKPNGQGLWRWSDGMMFTMALRDLTLMPGDEETYAASVPLTGDDGEPLPDGVYRVRFRVLGGIGELLTGSAPFQASGVIILGSRAASDTALM